MWMSMWGRICLKKCPGMSIESASVLLTACVNECTSVSVLMCLSVPCMSINVMLQGRGVCDMTDQRLVSARYRGEGSALGSRTIWKIRVTSMLTQSPCDAILHSVAPLLSFIVPSLFSPLTFLLLCLFPPLHPLLLSSLVSFPLHHSLHNFTSSLHHSPGSLFPWDIFGPSLRHYHGTIQGSLVT